MLAIEEAIEWSNHHGLTQQEVFTNTTLYVTVEPCIMCAGALRLMGNRQFLIKTFKCDKSQKNIYGTL